MMAFYLALASIVTIWAYPKSRIGEILLTAAVIALCVGSPYIAVALIWFLLR